MSFLRNEDGYGDTDGVLLFAVGAFLVMVLLAVSVTSIARFLKFLWLLLRG